MQLIRKYSSDASVFELVSDSFKNRYRIVSTPGSCALMASPEVIGFDTYKATIPATCAALKDAELSGSKASILTILRGGLNYPLEECAHMCSMSIPNINFLSCERIIEKGVITGLDVKYEKIVAEKDCTLMIGDIIASGDTLRLSLQHVVDYFKNNGGSLRRIVFFTIGGTKAIPLMEDLTDKIRAIWPGFEGFLCYFYEGIFTVYEDHGVTGVNIPNIDFGWKGGVVSPTFREFVLDYQNAPALLEKCIIYDGGARRYSIPDHYREVLEYWEELKAAADNGAPMRDFLEEKSGHSLESSFQEWLDTNFYAVEPCMKSIYQKEQAYLNKLAGASLSEICEKRIEQINKYFNN